MFNLLPENIKSEIKKEHKLRLWIVVFNFILFIQISFLIFLIPTWVSSFYREKDTLKNSEEMNNFLSTLNIASTTSFVRAMNSKLVTINDNLEYPEFTPIIDDLLSKRSSVIVLKGLNYEVKDSKNAVLSINGVGGSRESLVSFTKRLEEIDSFGNINLPISNLAKDKNIDFSISMDINK